jgi:hypothetical protein
LGRFFPTDVRLNGSRSFVAQGSEWINLCRATRREVANQPSYDLQVVKRREGSRVVEVKVEIIYGDETTLDLVGAHTSYVEGANLTSRHMNGRLVRKTLSFSKGLEKTDSSSTPSRNGV